MSTRVLSTDEGKAAIARLQQIINGDLTSQVKAVQEQGTTLSNPMCGTASWPSSSAARGTR